MAATSVSPASTEQTLEKEYKYIDLATMEEKTTSVQVKFTPAISVDEGLARLTSDQNRLNAINSQLKRLTLAEKRAETVSNGAPRGVVLKMAVPFRAMPPFSNMIVLGANGKATLESKRVQTKAILQAFAQNTMIVDMIRAKVAEGVDEDDEDGNDAE